MDDDDPRVEATSVLALWLIHELFRMGLSRHVRSTESLTRETVRRVHLFDIPGAPRSDGWGDGQLVNLSAQLDSKIMKPNELVLYLPYKAYQGEQMTRGRMLLGDDFYGVTVMVSKDSTNRFTEMRFRVTYS